MVRFFAVWRNTDLNGRPKDKILSLFQVSRVRDGLCQSY